MPIIGSDWVVIASASSAPAGATFGGLNRFPRLTPGATVQRPLGGLAHGPDITNEICGALHQKPCPFKEASLSRPHNSFSGCGRGEYAADAQVCRRSDDLVWQRDSAEAIHFPDGGRLLRAWRRTHPHFGASKKTCRQPLARKSACSSITAFSCLSLVWAACSMASTLALSAAHSLISKPRRS